MNCVEIPSGSYRFRKVVAGVGDPGLGGAGLFHSGWDTCRVDIDLGLGIWIRNEKLRLLRINAPEMTGSDNALGTASRDFLRDLIDGREIIIETLKDRRGKYGRYLAEIWIEKNEIWSNVNDALVVAGHAVYKEY